MTDRTDSLFAASKAAAEAKFKVSEPESRTLKVTRSCYDKPHRCPNRQGPGWNLPKEFTCEEGMVYDRNRLRQCPECSVWVLPYWMRFTDPSWHVRQLTNWVRDIRRRAYYR